MALVLRSHFALLLLLAAFDSGLVSSQNDSSPFKFPVGDPRNCPLAKGVYRFEVLPGSGWDNLRNQHMGLVFERNYSKCKTSDDSKFLIPDNMVLYPVKNSKVDTYADVYDHWTNYSTITAKSINAEASVKFPFFSISGSYSSEYESVKRHQVEDNTVTILVQLRHNLYKARIEPDSALSPAFKSRLIEIAMHLQQNNTNWPNYLAQMLVRDFGTHFISSINAGAVLAKMDHLKKKYLADYKGEKSEITAAASLSFFKLFGGNFSAKLGYSHLTGKQNLDTYTKNVAYSFVYTFGGPPFRVDFVTSQWEDQILDELVAVDRSGDPLHYAVTPGSLPEISEPLVFKVADVVKEAIKEYYKTNTIAGCTKMDSPNFSFRANFDDKSCESPTNNYTFGGVFQTCDDYVSPDKRLCQDLIQKNPLTSDFSCSDGYEAVLVYQGSTTAQRCYDPHCGYCQGNFRSCQVVCGFAYYSTYWCVARGEVPLNTGYLFGGLYSDSLNNPVTQDRSCPLKFYPLRFGATMQVCVSDDYEHGFPRSVPFGGFTSCSKGNPLGAGQSKLEKYVEKPGPPDWPKTCPTGYSQHLGAIEPGPAVGEQINGCEIRFCVKSNAFNSLGFPTIIRPPFMDTPPILNYTVPMHIINRDTGQVWFKPSNSPQWLLATKSSVKEYAAQNNLDKDGEGDGGMAAGAAGALGAGLTAFLGLLIAATVYGWRCYKTKGRFQVIKDTSSLNRGSSASREPLNSEGHEPEYGSVTGDSRV